MRTLITIAVISFLLLHCKGQNKIEQVNSKKMDTKYQIYHLQAEDINGNIFEFSQLKGKKIMIVNTASKCGFTPQYAQLQELYNKYKDSGFIILGFPSNNFLWQEPGTNPEIANFCQLNYGVTFPMMSKILVKGKNKHPVYQFLTKKKLNGFSDSKVKWNFQKYLINKEGYLCGIISSKTKPLDPQILNWIESKETDN